MPHGPQRMANVLAELMARRGYGRIQSTEAYEDAWRTAAGPLAARYTRVGTLRRGALEVIVANSTVMQELGFQKSAILQQLAVALPQEGIRSLRFRLGNVE